MDGRVALTGDRGFAERAERVDVERDEVDRVTEWVALDEPVEKDRLCDVVGRTDWGER